MSYILFKAAQTAEGFTKILSPHCDRFHIAGSIRRRQSMVSDIEIVCTPKKELKKDPEKLFDEGTLVISPDFIHVLATITDAIIKGQPEGRYMQIKTKSRICPGIYLDLFMPQQDDYYRQLAIRTGSRQYVHHNIASAWTAKGWVGCDKLGLRRKDDCEPYTSGDKTLWRLRHDRHPDMVAQPPAWKSEAEFFLWLGVAYIDPQYREYKPTLNEAQ